MRGSKPNGVLERHSVQRDAETSSNDERGVTLWRLRGHCAAQKAWILGKRPDLMDIPTSISEER